MTNDKLKTLSCPNGLHFRNYKKCNKYNIENNGNKPCIPASIFDSLCHLASNNNDKTERNKKTKKKPYNLKPKRNNKTKKKS